MNRAVQGFDPYIYLKHKVGEKVAHLTRSFHYIDKDGVKHTSHPHLCTDGLSIPRFLWCIFGPPFASIYLAGGIIHDSKCYDAKKPARAGDLKLAKAMRLKADQLFREMLLFLGASRVTAWAMHRGVRIGALSLNYVAVEAG